MIKLEMIVDDIDYEAASDLLLPLLADKLKNEHKFAGNLLGSNMTGSFAKTMLRSMPQEKKDALAVKTLNGKKELLEEKAEELLREKNIHLKIKELSVYDH